MAEKPEIVGDAGRSGADAWQPDHLSELEALVERVRRARELGRVLNRAWGDFAVVSWFGVEHHFATRLQRAVVRELWRRWEQYPGEGLSERELRDLVGASADPFRLSKVLKPTHPAWGQMIERVAPGVFRLNPVPAKFPRESQPIPRTSP